MQPNGQGQAVSYQGESRTLQRTSTLHRALQFSLLLLFTGCVPLASAADERYQEIWQHATFYTSEQGPLRRIALSGRLQADASYFDADEGDFEDINWRRFRFGFTAGFSNDWMAQLEADFDLNESHHDWYSRLTDAYIGWQPDKARDLRLLKHSAGFTLDGATSSKKLLTLQRNNLTNNLWFTAEYFTGASIKGALDNNWTYRVGVFSSDGNDEFSKFDAGIFTLTSAGYDFAQALGIDRALVRLDYVYNERDENANTRDLSNVTTLSAQWEDGDWGLWTDLGSGRGYMGQSDISGVTIMPFYNVSELVQLVVRYTYIDSDEANGVRLGRYENEIVDGRGDQYDELYLGFNLFFYGHKLKLQSGLQFAELKDRAGDGGRYRGWGIGTGLRISW
ncbi:porin [Pseudohalioglobus sediminis]|uniref:porin n=1 Tax=Pseudohalioglobus sediminis TaxID=2606449 RepID=UPI00165F0893|nr:porin [Pseudohalioglobus sediminis]